MAPSVGGWGRCPAMRSSLNKRENPVPDYLSLTPWYIKTTNVFGWLYQKPKFLGTQLLFRLRNNWMSCLKLCQEPFTVWNSGLRQQPCSRFLNHQTKILREAVLGNRQAHGDLCLYKHTHLPSILKHQVSGVDTVLLNGLTSRHSQCTRCESVRLSDS